MSDLTVYKQIYPNQCQTLIKLGFASVINVRPDGEADNQPSSAVLATSCKQADLDYAHVPFVSANDNDINKVQNDPQSYLHGDNQADNQVNSLDVNLDDTSEKNNTCPRLSHATIKQFAEAYHTLPKPILMFCGTGSRAKLLYQTAVLEGLI